MWKRGAFEDVVGGCLSLLIWLALLAAGIYFASAIWHAGATQ